MKTYNKLVRDRIPEMIEKSGKKFEIRTLTEEEYITELQKKTNEEFLEYVISETNEEALEELADMLECIRALASVHGASFEQLEEIRVKKFEARGAFENKVFLVESE